VRRTRVNSVWRAFCLFRDRRKLGDRSFRLRGFSRHLLLGGGELALQALILGFQCLDVGFEDVQTRRMV
jgi:hypothetical protein